MPVQTFKVKVKVFTCGAHPGMIGIFWNQFKGCTPPCQAGVVPPVLLADVSTLWMCMHTMQLHAESAQQCHNGGWSYCEYSSVWTMESESAGLLLLCCGYMAGGGVLLPTPLRMCSRTN